jgi:hypothetical protein
MYQTEVMIASAVMKKGEEAGTPVALNCTWYKCKDDSRDFIVIEGVTNCCY